jgi:EF-P beta-lysylation protein EpmB
MTPFDPDRREANAAPAAQTAFRQENLLVKAPILTTSRSAERCAPLFVRPWAEALRTAARTARDLASRLGLDDRWVDGATDGSAQFPVLVPDEFLVKVVPGDPHDPLLIQVLPGAAEAADVPGFSLDPLHERAARTAPGLLQKYDGRALMVTTGACAVHCRYCFRRHYDYSNEPHGLREWTPALDAIQADPSIHEVLLSGGDPLTLVDDRLASLMERLSEIPHLRRLRIHTRLPIMIPQRITPSLVDLLARQRLAVWMVVHANHPRELDQPTLAALGKLRDAGLPVLNQAVLLRGVNDDVQVLHELCERLIDHRMQPYYLHQLDPVAGAAHFRVPIECGQQIIEQLRARLPGYAVPQYVWEQPGADSKMPL